MDNNQSSLVDLSYLGECAGDDTALMNELIDSFYETVEESLTELKKSLAEDDNRQWVEAAHKLKGASGYVGAADLKSLCATAQGMDQATQEERSDSFEKIQQGCGAVRKVLEEIRP